MPDNLPTPARPLSTSSSRAVAATALVTATGTPALACSLLVDALDHSSWGVLAAAGATPVEALVVLRLLWADEPTATGGITRR